MWRNNKESFKRFGKSHSFLSLSLTFVLIAHVLQLRIHLDTITVAIWLIAKPYSLVVFTGLLIKIFPSLKRGTTSSLFSFLLFCVNDYMQLSVWNSLNQAWPKVLWHFVQSFYCHVMLIMIREDNIQWTKLILFTFWSNAQKSGMMLSLNQLVYIS